MAATKTRLSMLLGAVAIPLAAAGLPSDPDDELRFSTQPGARITKAFHLTLEVEFSDGSLWMRLHDRPGKTPLEGPLERKLSLLEEQWVDLVEEHVPAEADQPEQLRRTVNRLMGRLKQRDAESNRSYEEQESGLLEGATVLFALDEAGHASAPRYETPGERDETLLAELEGDVDLRAILPAKAVQPGDEWTIGPEALLMICRPGGPIAYPQGEREAPFLGDWLAGNPRGSLRVRYAGMPSADGVLVAVLEVEGDVEIRSTFERPGGPDVMFATFEGTDDVDQVARFSVKGEVLWNVEARRLHEAELDARVVLERETYSRSTDGNVETRIRERWSGSLRAGASFR